MGNALTVSASAAMNEMTTDCLTLISYTEKANSYQMVIGSIVADPAPPGGLLHGLLG
jgi:hypothetical protein